MVLQDWLLVNGYWVTIASWRTRYMTFLKFRADFNVNLRQQIFQTLVLNIAFVNRMLA
jgi:hypothetical protein